jgi:hypothetical protein
MKTWLTGMFSGKKTTPLPNHNQTITLRTRKEMVFEKLVFSPLNHLTWLIAQENFIINHLVVNFNCFIFIQNKVFEFDLGREQSVKIL